MSDRRLLSAVVALAVAGVACGGGGEADRPVDGAGTPSTGADGSAAPDPAAGSADTPSPPLTRPDWLGTRVLEAGEPPPTPPELDPRRLSTIDVLPPPADGAFHATVAPVSPEVAARSTWHDGCPVALADLGYVTVSFWGFDDRAHTGELVVHRDAAEPLVSVFERLFDMRFPIEEMHVTTVAELDAPNTGDGNATAAFVCRATRGSARWSEHAYGLAVDINPFQNPYQRGGGVTPGLASSYLDRTAVRPGMIVAGDGVVAAFADIGWGWGGAWRNPIDHMHFSANDR